MVLFSWAALWLVSYRTLASFGRAFAHLPIYVQNRTNKLSLVPQQFRGSTLEALEHPCALKEFACLYFALTTAEEDSAR